MECVIIDVEVFGPDFDEHQFQGEELLSRDSVVAGWQWHREW
jgi:hypothetical protein